MVSTCMRAGAEACGPRGSRTCRLRGLGCACGSGHDWGRHLISTLSVGFPSCGFLLVQLSLLAIRHLQANVLSALLVEMATTAREDQGEDKSDDDTDDDADDDPD
jgi:hypothetical protein